MCAPFPDAVRHMITGLELDVMQGLGVYVSSNGNN